MAQPRTATEPPLWPLRLRDVCLQLRTDIAPEARNQLREEAWLLLNPALRRYLGVHARRLGRLSPEDVEDIAAAKSLDLIRRAEHGSWDPSGHGAAEVTAYLSSVSRNGLVDVLREKGRFVRSDGTEEGVDPRDTDGHRRPTAAPDDAERAGERHEFVRGLCDCVRQLATRSRTAWLLRVLYDMPTKEIAAHPEVELKPSHVDVLLQRTRQALRKCVGERGYEPSDMPPSVLVTLWEVFCLNHEHIEGRAMHDRERGQRRRAAALGR